MQYVERKPRGRPSKEWQTGNKAAVKKAGYSLVVRIPSYYCRSFNILPRDRKGNPGSGFTWTRKDDKSKYSQ